MIFNGQRDVFNSYKLKKEDTKDYSKCRLIANSVGYQYFIFDAQVYSVDDLNMNNPICTVNDFQ